MPAPSWPSSWLPWSAWPGISPIPYICWPTGMGKTTLLKNIIPQDLSRTVGTPEAPHRIPMVIFDGKGDLDFFHDLLPHIHHAGRLKDLRVLNPARTDISVRYKVAQAKERGVKSTNLERAKCEYQNGPDQIDKDTLIVGKFRAAKFDGER